MRRTRMAGWLFLPLVMAGPLTVEADVYDCYTRKGDPACEWPLDESKTCRYGQDFDIRTMERDSQATVLSIHAGRIELEAGAIADELAAFLNWDFYEFLGYGTDSCLEGMSNPAVLHITSTSYNESTLVSMVSNDRRTISIHGYSGSASDDPEVEVICAGGRDDSLIRSFAGAVARRSSGSSGFDLVVDGGPEPSYPMCRRLGGKDENNIVNRNSQGAGMQLELSLRLRRALVESSPSGDSLRDLFYGSVEEGLIRADRNREAPPHGGRDGPGTGTTPRRSHFHEAISRFVVRLMEKFGR